MACFRTTLNNPEMMLAKTDTVIAGACADLVDDKSARDAIVGRIQSGWLKTVE